MRRSSCAWRASSSAARSAAEGVLALLFPPRCLVCDGPAEGLGPLCRTCEEGLLPLGGERCVQCEEPLGDPWLDLCRPCGTRDRGFDLARSLGPYESGWGTLVRSLKFERERLVARFLADRLAAHLAEKDPFGPLDVITPVPMARADQRRRGFNQAALLARGVGRGLGLPVEPLLVKVRQTPPQAELPAMARRENLRGAFRPIRSGAGRVLLVDDIYTTGSTVEACARALKSGGWERVFVLTVARA